MTKRPWPLAPRGSRARFWQRCPATHTSWAFVSEPECWCCQANQAIDACVQEWFRSPDEWFHMFHIVSLFHNIYLTHSSFTIFDAKFGAYCGAQMRLTLHSTPLRKSASHVKSMGMVPGDESLLGVSRRPTDPRLRPKVKHDENWWRQKMIQLSSSSTPQLKRSTFKVFLHDLGIQTSAMGRSSSHGASNAFWNLAGKSPLVKTRFI